MLVSLFVPIVLSLSLFYVVVYVICVVIVVYITNMCCGVVVNSDVCVVGVAGVCVAVVAVWDNSHYCCRYRVLCCICVY